MGNPLRLILTQGQASEYGQAEALIDSFQAGYVLADKGYDSNSFMAKIESLGAVPVVPPRGNRLVKRAYDKVLYRERNLVERLFQKLKAYRRIATRYERLATHYHSMLYLAAAVIWLD